MSSESVSLSRREQQVLDLICTGMADKEVAAQLSITCATVRTYVARLEQKLGAANRAQLALLARNIGFVGQSGIGGA